MTFYSWRLLLALTCILCLSVAVGQVLADDLLDQQTQQAIDAWFAMDPDSRGACPDDCLAVTGLSQQDYAKLKDRVWGSYRRGAVKLGWQSDLMPTQYLSKMMKDAKQSGRPNLKTAFIELPKDRKMPYILLAKGKKPKHGWPLFISMHGGGRSSKKQDDPHGWDVNSREWQTQIQFFFRVYPDNAAYFIPRMVDDNDGRWKYNYNYAAYDQMIRRAILFHDVDPNRVYMMGISQGGYGTEALSTFMTDRLAAVCAMAAGAGDSYMENLRNLPRRTDVGENDTMYGRIKLARKCHQRLDELKSQDAQGYLHQLAVQKGRGHGIDYRQGPEWLTKFSRNAYPKRVVWSSNKLHGGEWSSNAYWLGLDTEASGPAFLTATVDQKNNRIEIQAEQPASTDATDGPSTDRQPLTQRTISVYLHDQLVDLDKPVEIRINGKTVANRKFERSLGEMMLSLSDRGDPDYVFPAKAEFSL